MMEAFLSVTHPNGVERAPLPVDTLGQPFLPSRGDMIRYGNREFIAEAVKWYFDPDDFQKSFVVVFANEMK